MPKNDSKPLAEQIGRAIARQRASRDLSQEKVAEKLNIGAEAVSRIERGLVMPNVERLVELAAIFECETADLLTEGRSLPADQAKRLQNMLNSLSAEDRLLVLDIVERLVERLAHN